jgi:hypothetical protein
MADIAKCPGVECPIKEKCYRFTAPCGYWQSQLTKEPYRVEEEMCGLFLPIEENFGNE